jgi:DNA-binding Lrp family transcriptional regulator
MFINVPHKEVIMAHMFQLDDRDMEILLLLMKNSKQSLGQLSQKLGIPKSSIYRKITKLEQDGVIKNYSIAIDFEKIGKPITSFILISVLFQSTERSQEEIALDIIKIPEIYEIHIITGEYDMIAKARTKSVEELGDIIVKSVRNIEGVGKTITNVALKKIKEEIYSVQI